jgi:NAD(P)-dependent dehydrogenase (short-subunit alcohol dehydrogenase family)
MTSSQGSLEGKVAAVTGATSGSGRAIAARFADEGASVVLLARAADRLEDLESQLGPATVGLPTDVGNADSVRASFAAIADRFGKLDILVNNAAVYRPCPVEELSDEDIVAHVSTNFIGPVHTCRAAIPLLRAAGSGDIVNTSTQLTEVRYPMMTMYVSSKAALEMFSQMLMDELPDDDIRVTTFVQGTAKGEGGGSTGWSWDPVMRERTDKLWTEQGLRARTVGRIGMSVEAIADVHLFIVTRPRGQRLHRVHCFDY